MDIKMVYNIHNLANTKTYYTSNILHKCTLPFQNLKKLLSSGTFLIRQKQSNELKVNTHIK